MPATWRRLPRLLPSLQGALGQDVAGLGGYTKWNQHLYAAGTLYPSAHVGAASYPITGEGFTINIRRLAPYWRVAWQRNGLKNNFEIGTYGIHLTSTPGAITGPGMREWMFQYDRTIGKDVFSWRGTYVQENSDLVASLAGGAAAVADHHLNAFNTNAEYYFGNRYSAAVGWFTTTGTRDPLLCPQAAVTGSARAARKALATA